MLKRRKIVPGAPPGALKPLTETPSQPPVITLIEYDANFLEERVIPDVGECLPHMSNDRVTWINIDGLGDLNVLRVLGKEFNLHPLALEDVLDVGQRPKVEQYDGYLFIVVHMADVAKDGAIRSEQVSMFLGKNFLITLQEEADFDVFEPVRTRIRAASGQMRKLGNDYLAYALLDSIIDHYYPALESVGIEIDKIEDEIAIDPLRRPVGHLHEYKRQLARVRRLIWPLRDVTSSLLHEETGLVSSNTKVYLRDCYDHSVQLMDLVESYRDVLSGLTEIHISSIGLRTNEIMRVLTVISSVFIPLTFIAGVYGMNFASEKNGQKLPWNMPELYHPYGYIICLAVMLLIAVGQLIYFKKRGWL